MLNVRSFLLTILINSFPAVIARAPVFRIIGGYEVENGEMPFQASLHKTLNDKHFCGGTIINESFILTAAHCLVDPNKGTKDPEDLFIAVGQIERELDAESMTRKVHEIIMHPQFNKDTGEHDIAILALAQKLAFNTTELVQPIRMREKEIVENLTCVVSGWGAQEFGGQHSPLLLKAFVETQTMNSCKKKFEKMNVTNYIRRGMICAFGFGEEDEPLDACNGDSGGPLVCNTEVAGIVSYGVSCGNPDFPGVYTDVPMYLPWIRKTISGFQFSKPVRRSKVRSSATHSCKNYLFLATLAIKSLVYSYYFSYEVMNLR